MRPRSLLSALATTALCGVCGACTAASGLDALSFSTTTGGGGAANSGGSSSAIASTTAGQAAGGSGGNGGEGAGGDAACGDGAIQPGEECDDGNTQGGDGCSDCRVDCSEAGAFKHPDSSHCYWQASQSLSWDLARADCQSAGADLVSFTAAAEHLFVIQQIVNTDSWIGASDHSGSWQWVDRTPWRYAPWEVGQPNDPNQNCVKLEDTVGLMFFHDALCSMPFRYICERRPAGE